LEPFFGQNDEKSIKNTVFPLDICGLLLYNGMEFMMGRGVVSMGEIIAVVSGKGGTGKTSICAGIATALAADKQRVLCIDCDVGLRNLDISLGLSHFDALSFLDVCSGDYDICHAAIHPEFPDLFFLTAPVNCSAEQIDTEAFLSMLRAARRDFDYILLDAPAGVDAGLQLAAKAADLCLLVTGAGPAAVRDAGRTGQVLELMGKNNIRLIVNRVKPKMISAMALTVDDIMDEAGLPLIGIVPEDSAVTLAATFGKALLRYSRRSPAAAACRRIARRMRGMHVPLSIK
jgi:septum site-determining protein MinD